jgi:hypothetical protein
MTPAETDIIDMKRRRENVAIFYKAVSVCRIAIVTVTAATAAWSDIIEITHNLCPTYIPALSLVHEENTSPAINTTTV